MVVGDWATKPYDSYYYAFLPDYATRIVLRQNTNLIKLYYDARNAGMNFQSGVINTFQVDNGAIIDFGYASGGKREYGFASGGSLYVQSPATITTMNNSGQIRTQSYVYGTILTLNLNGGTLGLSNSDYNLQGRISTLNINSYSITIDSSANEWNSQSSGTLDAAQATGSKGKQDEHIYADSSLALLSLRQIYPKGRFC